MPKWNSNSTPSGCCSGGGSGGGSVGPAGPAGPDGPQGPPGANGISGGLVFYLDTLGGNVNIDGQINNAFYSTKYHT